MAVIPHHVTPEASRLNRGRRAIEIIVCLLSIIGIIRADVLPTFGNPLFNPIYPLNVYDGGQISLLEADKRTVLNIRQVTDLLNYDVRFFQPDLVTDGQETRISMFGGGLHRTKAVWRGRPLRDPRTGNQDLNRLSHLWIGGLRSVHSGALSGVSGSHGTVELNPIDLVKSEPFTVLHHRDGFYGFQPVEFVHVRRLTPNTDLFAGGFFPSAQGRFENTEHDGDNLFAEVRQYLAGGKILSVGHQSRHDKVNLAFTDNSRSVKDNDFDISLVKKYSNGTTAQFFSYHLERVEKEGKFRAHSRDWGGGVRTVFGAVGFYLRSGRIYINMPSTEKIRILEIESSLSAAHSLKGIQLWGLVGINGWLPDRTGLNAAVTVDRQVNELGRFGLIINRNSDPLTPEMIYADYQENRPSKILDPVWRIQPDLPVQGRVLPKSTTDNIELYWEGVWRDYRLHASAFQKFIRNPVRWAVSDNSIISRTSANHRTRGWMTNLYWSSSPFRGSLSMVSIFRNEGLESGVPIVMAEPPFRLETETGWHQKFMDGRFEVDISLKGQYLNAYYSIVSEEREKMGAAYPLYFMMSGRIRSFTLYYGVHNWNSFQYYTVPGYKMMHKEEYWGIHWLIMN